MHGGMWLSAFRLREAVDEVHPAGTYAAALVRYVEPSPLTYSELLVARLNRGGSEMATGTVTVTDIWVDSPDSVAGGRELWALPKQLCDFDVDTAYRGPVTTAEWSATVDRRPVVEATFTDVSRIAPRVPMRGRVVQPGIDEHPAPASVVVTGTAKALPCRASWHFAADGPLAFLRGARRLASFRMVDFRLSIS
jgi:acetoacetate decarboxylase